MKPVSIHAKSLLPLFGDRKIATKEEIQKILGTSSRATMFRKLNELNYITSYTHGGKYYSLLRLTRFNKYGLWFYDTVGFSRAGTLIHTIANIIEQSEKGITVKELEEILSVKVSNPLLGLFEKNDVNRSKWGGVYVYYSSDQLKRRIQEINRKESLSRYTPLKEPALLMNEMKASLLTFFALLDEQQRRVFLGLESLKHGHGGDRLLAEIFGVTEKTVSRGRRELIENRLQLESVRQKGGGRKSAEKKRRRSRRD
jgi:hypothetical protein